MFLVMQGLQLIKGDVWGGRKDIRKYYLIEDKVFARIKELRSNGLDLNEIAGIVSREAELSTELGMYVIKQDT
jgi:hypothetical protein